MKSREDRPMKAVMVDVPSHWIIQRDTRSVRLLVRGISGWALQAADKKGWISSSVTRIELRTAADGKLDIRLAGRPETGTRVP